MGDVTYFLLRRKKTDYYQEWGMSDQWYLARNEFFAYGQPTSVLNPKRAMRWHTFQGAQQAAEHYGPEWEPVPYTFQGTDPAY